MTIFAKPPKDADAMFARDAWLRALQRTAAVDQGGVTLPALIARLADQFEAAPALVSPDETLSYRELAIRSNRYARWGLSLGLKTGDSVGLMLPNCAEYMAIWLGLARIGVVAALINTHLADEALVHSINTAMPRLVIVGGGLASGLLAVRARLGAGVSYRVHGPSMQDLAPLADEVVRFSGDTLGDAECAVPPIDGTALYIYTSGTTGLPKAAKVSHYRVMRWSQWFAGLMDTGPSDRMFNCLPLYHSVGGVVATGATLVGGGAVVIRDRFSVSDFWRDVRDERCTLFQYIGELCRYLVNAPPQQAETAHSLRVACGNGLRPEVWERFQERFRIPRIIEYYASTEGNFSLYNCEGRPGAIGKIPSFLAHRLPVALLRFDIGSGEPLRNADGRCERCAPGEVGEAIGLISGTDQLAGRFEGYADPQASARKVLHDVFKPGDSWYRTGDLMRCDEQGFYYFVDRVGDTFRWKGENVSTAEVLTVLMAARGVLDGVVYGVAIPGRDGRAGMAALVVTADFDLAGFRAATAPRLPAYARPVFLRLLRNIALTGTFKPRKEDLVQAGFDPANIADALFFDDPRTHAYVPMDAASFAAISAGMIRV